MQKLSGLTAAGTAHTNSTDEAVLASYTIPANFFQAGKTLRFRALARVTAQNSTDTATCRIRVGTVTLTGTALWTSGAVDAAVSDICRAEGTLTARSNPDPAGGNGTVIAEGSANDPDAEGQAAVSWSEILSSYAQGSDYLLEFTADWSVANAGNSIQAELFEIWED